MSTPSLDVLIGIGNGTFPPSRHDNLQTRRLDHMDIVVTGRAYMSVNAVSEFRLESNRLEHWEAQTALKEADDRLADVNEMRRCARLRINQVLRPYVALALALLILGSVLALVGGAL